MRDRLNREKHKVGAILKLEYGKPLPDEKRIIDGNFPVYGANGLKGKSNEYYCDKKSIVVGRKGSAGEINLTEDKFWPLDVTYFITFDEKKYNLFFLFYLLGILDLPNLAKGIKPGLNRNEVYDLEVFVPHLHEQVAIAEFLLNKCNKIDTIIALEEKSIAELNEYKKSIIQNTITKGISNAILKDSGVEWLGKIPQNWEIIRIGTIYQMRNTKVSDIDYPPLSVGYMGVVPQLENAAKTDDGDNRKLVLKNDFVINSRADRRGACGISELDGSVSLINIVLKPLKDACNNYYRYLFKSTGFSDEFYKWGNGIVDDLWSTKWSEMKRIYITVPPFAEQQAIAEYLDKKTNQVDNLISLKRQKITELKEYKKSLIYEYVTGKKEPPKEVYE